MLRDETLLLRAAEAFGEFLSVARPPQGAVCVAVGLIPSFSREIVLSFSEEHASDLKRQDLTDVSSKGALSATCTGAGRMLFTEHAEIFSIGLVRDSIGDTVPKVLRFSKDTIRAALSIEAADVPPSVWKFSKDTLRIAFGDTTPSVMKFSKDTWKILAAVEWAAVAAVIDEKGARHTVGPYRVAGSWLEDPADLGELLRWKFERLAV